MSDTSLQPQMRQGELATDRSQGVTAMQIGGVGGSTAAFSAQEQRRASEPPDGASLRDAAARQAERERQQRVEQDRQVETARTPARPQGLGTQVDRFA